MPCVPLGVPSQTGRTCHHDSRPRIGILLVGVSQIQSPQFQRRCEVAERKQNAMIRSHVVGLGRAVTSSDAEGGLGGRELLATVLCDHDLFVHKLSNTTKDMNQDQAATGTNELGWERWDKKIGGLRLRNVIRV